MPIHVNVCLSTKVSAGGGQVMDVCIMHQQYITWSPMAHDAADASGEFRTSAVLPFEGQ